MHGLVGGGQGIIVDMPHFLPRLKIIDHKSPFPPPDTPQPKRALNRSTLGKIRADGVDFGRGQDDTLRKRANSVLVEPIGFFWHKPLFLFECNLS